MSQVNAFGDADRHNWHTSLTYIPSCSLSSWWTVAAGKPILPTPRPKELDIRADYRFLKIGYSEDTRPS